MTGGPAPSLVKVCGLTRVADVILSVELGAWALGFVFAPSPRRITAAQALPLIAAARAADWPAVRDGIAPEWLRGCGAVAVGVFGDTSAEAIVQTVEAAGLDAVQLHGSRPRAGEVRGALRDRTPRVLIIQAVPVPAFGSPEGELRAAVAAAREAADLLLFDTCVAGSFGGTGTSFPWTLAREAAAGAPFLIAGGIGAHNVRQALAASGAAGVDVSSGVEVSPGVKDEDAIRALFAAVRPCNDQDLVEGRLI